MVVSGRTEAAKSDADAARGFWVWLGLYILMMFFLLFLASIVCHIFGIYSISDGAFDIPGSGSLVFLSSSCLIDRREKRDEIIEMNREKGKIPRRIIACMKQEGFRYSALSLFETGR